MHPTNLELIVILSCVELMSRKKMQDTWIFWLIYCINEFIKIAFNWS